MRFSFTCKRRDANASVVIQYMSDLHLERSGYQFAIDPAASILLLAGDIGRLHDFEKYAGFIYRCCALFEKVLLVGGNHEFYGTSHEHGFQMIESIANDPAAQGKLLFLNRVAYDIPRSDITILGCTLHSNIGGSRKAVTNDFRRIADWTVERHNQEHAADMAWLREQISSIKESRRIIIATHYAPAFGKTCHPMHRGSILNQCFASNALDNLLANCVPWTVTHWIHGHTHWNTKIRRGTTMIVSNQFSTKSNKLTWRQRKTLYMPFKMNATIKV